MTEISNETRSVVVEREIPFAKICARSPSRI